MCCSGNSTPPREGAPPGEGGRTAPRGRAHRPERARGRTARRGRTAWRGQALYQLGSGGLLRSENPCFLFGLFLPVHSTRSSSSALGASGEASEAFYNQVYKHIVVFPTHVHTHTHTHTHTQHPSHQEQTLSLCWAHG